MIQGAWSQETSEEDHVAGPFEYGNGPSGSLRGGHSYLQKDSASPSSFVSYSEKRIMLEM
jgi:hypothetical protein